MRSTLAVGIGLALSLPALAATAATKPPAQKAPPACAAITFRPLPSGMTDGEQQAGMYKSRHARLALHAQVKQGEPVIEFGAAKEGAAEPADVVSEVELVVAEAPEAGALLADDQGAARPEVASEYPKVLVSVPLHQPLFPG